MTKETCDLLMLLSIPAIFIGGVVLFIYSIHKSCQIDKENDDKAMAIAEEKLKEEMTKTKYRIRFVDSGREEHITSPYDPRISRNYYTRNLDRRYGIRPSLEVAENALSAAYEAGYIEDAEGNTFPTCNLHKLSIEEAK